MKEFFRKFAATASNAAGTPWAFLGAVSSIVAWAAAGPGMRYSDTWMLVVGTFTTIVTYLMVFLIQSSQNRDTRAQQVKLNAIIAALEGTSNHLIDLESQAEEELDKAVEEIKAYREEDG